MLFDFGDATSPEGKRNPTTVATQALFVMNSPMVDREAKALADRVLTQEKKDSARISEAYVAMLDRRADRRRDRCRPDLHPEPSPPMERDRRSESMAELLPCPDGIERIYLRILRSRNGHQLTSLRKRPERISFPAAPCCARPVVDSA